MFIQEAYYTPRAVVTRTPFRISFCGGGTDLPAYYERHGWGAVCSMAIDKYMYVMAKELPKDFPYRYKLAYSKTELCSTPLAIEHQILREAVTQASLPSLDFASQADIPSGAGMGSSSAFTVGTLNAISCIKHAPATQRDLAEGACELEINRLQGSLGKQDQYAAAFGGLNYFRFVADGSVQVSPIRLSRSNEKLFCSHLRLYYLGSSRPAESVLKSQAKSGSALDIMREQAKICADMFHYNGHPKDLGELLEQAWSLKKSLSKDISSPEIDDIYYRAREAGIYGGKLLGAGSTGYLLVCCPPDLELDLSLPRIDVQMDHDGTKALRI